MRAVLKIVAGGAAVAALALSGCERKPVPPLVLATDTAVPPYTFMEGDQVKGIDVAVARAVAEAEGRELQVLSLRFERVLPALADGKAELAAAAIPVRAELKEQADFSLAYGVGAAMIIRRAGNTKVSGRKSLKGKRVGVLAGSAAERMLREECGARVVPFDPPAGAFSALTAGLVDAVVTDRDMATVLVAQMPEVEVLPEPLFVDEYALAVRKGDAHLLRTANEVIARIVADGTYVRIREEALARYAAQTAAVSESIEADLAAERDAPLEAVMEALDDRLEEALGLAGGEARWGRMSDARHPPPVAAGRKARSK